MPPRTNSFQKLIVHLHQSLGPDTVVESVMFDDVAAEVTREVDIVVYKSSLGRNAHVAIECVDWQSPADVPWVEQMRGKHGDIGSDQLLLVSANGFTKGARNKADYYGIKLLVPQPDAEWGADVLRTVQDRYLSCVTTNVDRCIITVIAGEAEKRLRAEPEVELYDANGNELGSVYNYVVALLGSREMQRQLVLVAQSHPDAGWFQIGFQPPKPSPTLVAAFRVPTTSVEVPLGDRVGSGMAFLRNNDTGGLLERIVDLNIVGQFACLLGPARMKMGTIDGQRVVWGTATLDGKVMLVSAVGGSVQLYEPPPKKKKH